MCLLLSAVVWLKSSRSGRERSSKTKQELARDMLPYSRKQQGVTTVTAMTTGETYSSDCRLLFRKGYASSVVLKPDSRLRQSRPNETNGCLDFVPAHRGLNERECVSEVLHVSDSPAHNFMCEQNSAHFWILVLSFI